MTATDDRVWSEFGYRTPEEIAEFRAQELAGVDVCTCTHYRREHFEERCAHSESWYAPARLRRECPCEGFEEKR